MVDRASRDHLATSLRHLAAGVITNDQFEDRTIDVCTSADDPALWELWNFAWLHYHDFKRYRLRGRHALSRAERRSVARVILFLKSDQAFEHEPLLCGSNIGLGVFAGGIVAGVIAGLLTWATMGTFVLGLVSVGLSAFLLGHLMEALQRRATARTEPALPDTFWPIDDKRASDERYRYWPFADNAAYARALANPPYLCGNSRNDAPSGIFT